MEITKQYDLLFPLEQVYRAWVSSDTVIAPATAMDINPVVGGHYRLIMEMPDMTLRNEGLFTLVEPNAHIQYSWEWNDDGEITEIDATFSEIEGGTRINILHTGFQKEESVKNHDAGWDNYVSNFSAFLAG